MNDVQTPPVSTPASRGLRALMARAPVDDGDEVLVAPAAARPVLVADAADPSVPSFATLYPWATFAPAVEDTEEQARRSREEYERRGRELVAELAREAPARARLKGLQEAHDAAVQAGPPMLPHPGEGRDAARRVADASRFLHAEWTDHLVAVQPMHEQAESHLRFAEGVMPLEETSRLLHVNRWSWYPQSRDADRRPCGWGEVPKMQLTPCRDGVSRMLQARNRRGRPLTRRVETYPTRYRERAPDEGLCADWVRVAPYESNVAIQCCAANLHNWVVDLDIEHAGTVATVRALAEQHLGVTPYDRGRSDSAKVALMYRHGLDDVAAFRFEVIRLPGDLGAIEFLGSGRQITWHGRHWKTGAVFRSSGPLPGMDPGATPDLAPFVTVAQLRDFKAAVREAFGVPAPVPRASRIIRSSEVQAGTIGDVPVRRLDRADYVGVTRGTDGLVHDQRDGWLWAHARALAAVNADLDEATFASLLLEDAEANLATDGKWGGGVIETKVAEKAPRALQGAREWAAGAEARRRQRGTAVVGGRELAHTPHVPAVHRDPSLRAVVPSVRWGDRVAEMDVVRSDPDPALAAARELLADRTEVMARVGDEVRAALTDWVRALYDVARGAGRADLGALQARARRVMLVRGPTGSGKTATFLDVCKTERARAREAGFRGRVTILMMLPSYALLEDVAHRLDPPPTTATASSGDGERARMAEVEEAARAAGLDVMQYRGKAHTCGRQKEWKILADAGVGTAGMCRSTSYEVEEDPDTGRALPGADRRAVTTRCWVWEQGLCEHQSQKARVAQSDLVLLPTAYVTLPIPKELQAASALVVDEAVAGHFARNAVLDPAWLDLERRVPRLTKAERAKAEELYPDMSPEDARETMQGVLMQDRREACRLARACIERGDDVAGFLVDHVAIYLKSRQTGLQLAETALSVAGRAADVHDEVTVGIDVDAARAIATNPKATGLLQEIRFWRLVVERIEGLIADRAAHEAREATVIRWKRLQINSTPPAVKLTTFGDRDARIRITNRVEPGEDVPRRMVRMSWRPRHRLVELPTMLLDASADVHMLRKVWPGRELDVRCDAAVPLHLRTVWLCDRRVSLRSRLPYKHKAIARRCDAARELNATRDLIVSLSGVYAHSRLLVSCPKQLEIALNTSWVAPRNVDFIHDGATVGLDFARFHAAALIIGQTDLPIEAIDDQVACWTYDDPEPETPIDALGTGLLADGETEVRCPEADVEVPMRDGSTVAMPTGVYPGVWARRVQLQTREEQQRQGIGRLRPVYKAGDRDAPVVYVLGQVIPSGIVVDELAVAKDVARRLGHYREAREHGCLPVAQGLGTRYERWREVIASDPIILTTPAESDHHHGLSRHSYDRGDGPRVTVDVLAHEDPAAAIARYEAAKGDSSVYDPETADIRPDGSNRPLGNAIPRPVDPKMVALLGPAADRAAAAEAALAEVARRDAARSWPKEVIAARLTAGAKAALLTVRPRTPQDPANRVDTLLNLDVATIAAAPASIVTPVQPDSPVVVTEPPGRTGPDDPWDEPVCWSVRPKVA